MFHLLGTPSLISLSNSEHEPPDPARHEMLSRKRGNGGFVPRERGTGVRPRGGAGGVSLRRSLGEALRLLFIGAPFFFYGRKEMRISTPRPAGAPSPSPEAILPRRVALSAAYVIMGNCLKKVSPTPSKILIKGTATAQTGASATAAAGARLKPRRGGIASPILQY